MITLKYIYKKLEKLKTKSQKHKSVLVTLCYFFVIFLTSWNSELITQASLMYLFWSNNFNKNFSTVAVKIL